MGVFTLVPVTVVVGVAPGVDVAVDVTVTVGVGDAPGVDVAVGVAVTVGVLAGVFVVIGVMVGVTAAPDVGEGVGRVALGVGVLRRGLDVAVLAGMPFRALLSVASTRAASPCAPVGVARQGFGGNVGVTSG